MCSTRRSLWAPLSTTRWYGSDGVALSAALTGDATAAAFAASVDYPNPIFGLPDSLQSEWQPISDEIEARTGIKADAFALSTYDALFIIQRALEDVGDLRDFAAFKAAFASEVDAYVGITGSMALNSAGDRANGDFDFWAVRNDIWVRIGLTATARSLSSLENITVPFPIRTLHLDRRRTRPVAEGHEEARAISRGEQLFQCLSHEQIDALLARSRLNHFGRAAHRRRCGRGSPCLCFCVAQPMSRWQRTAPLVA